MRCTVLWQPSRWLPSPHIYPNPSLFPQDFLLLCFCCGVETPPSARRKAHLPSGAWALPPSLLMPWGCCLRWGYEPAPGPQPVGEMPALYPLATWHLNGVASEGCLWTCFGTQLHPFAEVRTLQSRGCKTQVWEFSHTFFWPVASLMASN